MGCPGRGGAPLPFGPRRLGSRCCRMRSSALTISSEEPVESAQYACPAYLTAQVAVGVRASVSIVGDSSDHALDETADGLYKTELICSTEDLRIGQ